MTDLLTCTPQERRAFFRGSRLRAGAKLPHSRPPLGSLPGEPELIETARDLRARGHTHIEIARILDRQGWETRTGVQWTWKSVQALLGTA